MQTKMKLLLHKLGTISKKKFALKFISDFLRIVFFFVISGLVESFRLDGFKWNKFGFGIQWPRNDLVENISKFGTFTKIY